MLRVGGGFKKFYIYWFNSNAGRVWKVWKGERNDGYYQLSRQLEKIETDFFLRSTVMPWNHDRRFGSRKRKIKLNPPNRKSSLKLVFFPPTPPTAPISGVFRDSIIEIICTLVLWPSASYYSRVKLS